MGGRAILIRHVLLALPIHHLAAVNPPERYIGSYKKIHEQILENSGQSRKILENTTVHHEKVSVILILKEEIALEASPILAKLLELKVVEYHNF